MEKLDFLFLNTKRWRNKTILPIFIFFFFPLIDCYSQNRILDVGLRFQKSINLYYENGVSFHYTDETLFSQRLYVGFSYVTSRLGSAWGSNALKQDNFLLSSTYFFRPMHKFQPFVRLNAGYFYADLESDIFDDLPNTSFLLSPEAGIGLKTNSPFKIMASIGYNVLTGDGIDGPGTLYPVFIQTTISWNIIKSKKMK